MNKIINKTIGMCMCNTHCERAIVVIVCDRRARAHFSLSLESSSALCSIDRVQRALAHVLSG